MVLEIFFVLHYIRAEQDWQAVKVCACWYILTILMVGIVWQPFPWVV